jgi:hypothetical protein
MIQRHKNRLVRLLSKELITHELITLGFIWIKELEKNKIILNCKKLEWNLLYTNIILQLTNEGLIELEDSKKRDIKYFIENKVTLKVSDPDMYNVLKFMSNRLYGELFNSSLFYASLITTYIKMYYTEILQNNPNIFYVDVDQVYYTGEIDYFDLLDLGIEYKITNINCFFFSDKKKYIEISDSETRCVGYLRNATNHNINTIHKIIEIENELYSIDDILSQMKALLREQQISSVID